jgi:hypothetical protein
MHIISALTTAKQIEIIEAGNTTIYLRNIMAPNNISQKVTFLISSIISPLEEFPII